MKLTFRLFIVGIAFTALWGCATFSEKDALKLVNSVGAERVRQAADSLRPPAGTERRELPKESWPDALRDLNPESVVVEANGVWISKWHRFVEGSGIHVVFPGVAEPEERGGDPSMSRLGERIYWYQFTG